MRRPAFIALAAAFLGAAAVRADAQTNFTTYVSVGDSLAAGFESGSLVETHQNRSVPALIARQAGVQGFQQPLISEPGIPPEFTLVSLVPVPVIAPKAATAGAPKNLALARPYHNLAVPGATSVDALTRTTDAGGLHDLILRGLGTQVQQAVALRPTAITLWIGNNDVLGAALRGRAIDGVTLTPTATFRATYGQIVAALKTTSAFIVAANLPDVTTIPFVTTIRPYVVNPSTGAPVLVGGARVPLIGPSGSLPSTALVTLAASTLLGQGIGIPTALGGTGAPLPDEVVLDPSEIAIIQDHVAANNQAIREICGAANIPVLDVNGLLRELATTGRHVGGITLNSAFLSGGVFSYDGIHPNDVGYALMANEFIRVINASGGSLTPVDLAAVLGVTGASA
ncbi:MAG TPA: SGNH/GDSL hydrolase family protein, partial [Vicinamibacteria bacterium]|nr:SGNH/GDSL hydrolase family protein [Vicinamibacteria bacterium]